MLNRSATISVRIEPQVKEEAESVLKRIGLSTSDAVNIYFRQIAMSRGIPFEVKAEMPTRISADSWTREGFIEETNRRLAAAKEGKNLTFDEAKAKFEKEVLRR